MKPAPRGFGLITLLLAVAIIALAYFVIRGMSAGRPRREVVPRYDVLYNQAKDQLEEVARQRSDGYSE